jgi:hypothetical protein
MLLTPLLSMAGAAGATLAGAAVCAVGKIPFADFFGGEEEAAVAPASPPLEPLAPSGDAEQTARDTLDRFRKALGAKLAELGITGEQPIQLSIDSLGKIHETSGHPQGAEIESILAEDNQLSRDFRQANSQLELARAAREHAQFSALYATNPDLAVSTYGHLLDDQREPPQLTIRIDAAGATPVFE